MGTLGGLRLNIYNRKCEQLEIESNEQNRKEMYGGAKWDTTFFSIFKNSTVAQMGH